MHVCSSCLSVISVTAASLIRRHGSIEDKCPGSGKPPKQLNAALLSPVSSEDPISSPRACPTTPSCPPVSREPIPAVWVLERVPRAARHQCHLKLTTILEAVEIEHLRRMEPVALLPYELCSDASEIER